MSRQIRPDKLNSVPLTEFINVRVIDLSSEENFRGHHGVLIWQVDFGTEQASLIGGVTGTRNLDEEMSLVFLIWFNDNSTDYTRKGKYGLEDAYLVQRTDAMFPLM